MVILEKDKEVFMAALLKAYNEAYGTNVKDQVMRFKAGKQWYRVNNLLKRTKGKKNSLLECSYLFLSLILFREDSSGGRNH